MSTKHLRKSAILLIGAIVIAFGLLPARLSAQELTLTAGATTTVAPGDAVCITDLVIRNDATASDAKKDLGCTNAAPFRLFTNLATGLNVVPHRVDLTATARFVKQFHVQAVQGAATPSFVPILIAVPVSWQGTLFNDSSVLGPSTDIVGAHIDENMFLRVTQGDPQAPIPPRTNVTENRFNAASHAGISGCLSIPTDGPAAAATAVSCLLALLQFNEASATVYLSTIVETGKTYNIELVLRSDLFSANSGVLLGGLGGHPQGNFEIGASGLVWTDPMTITVGTDFQSNIQGLQDEINQLRADLNMLRQEFKTHTHVYLTGKGVGQNNTKVNTGPPVF